MPISTVASVLRSRSAPPAPAAGDRIRELLARPGGGWVPPPLPGWDEPEEGPEPAERADEQSDLTPDRPLAPDLLPAPVDLPSASERRWAGLVPFAVRTGRLDPGRSGAVALVLAALVAAVVAGGFVLRARPQEVPVPRVLQTGAALPGSSVPPIAGASEPATEVVVAVAGKVNKPGVVRLPAGSRVVDALRAAGGPLPGASTGLLNLARRLVDGEQVLVGIDPPPGAGNGSTGSSGSSGSSGVGSAGGPLDLNAATVADLDGLPGIGPVLAQRIIDWRTEHQRFASVDQLREVTGIGEAKFSDLRAKVTV